MTDVCCQTGRPFEQMMLVFDLDHISSAHYSCKAFSSSFTTLILLFQEHYPLVLKKILIIRAPEMARLAFKTMTPFLSDKILVHFLLMIILV
ncbi:unnamed protein product [Gongylonema pulchrum]|uniref:CRAL-TRIO domain-containing protein n=1 Tax=Gongylonema pulchrum TaxID=637853 RepID=A0A183F1I8_9BILA|nr:unnamed protein product [Gongylonema pulchrum]